MKAGWRSIAITAALAALASGAGTWASTAWLMKRQEAPSLHSIVHHQLDLTTEQETRLEAIEARFASRRGALEAEVRTANRELADAIVVSQGHRPGKGPPGGPEATAGRGRQPDPGRTGSARPHVH